MKAPYQTVVPFLLLLGANPAEAARLSGRVLDAGAPLEARTGVPGVEIVVYNEAQQALCSGLTDPGGRFAVICPPQGDVVVHASRIGWRRRPTVMRTQLLAEEQAVPELFLARESADREYYGRVAQRSADMTRTGLSTLEDSRGFLRDLQLEERVEQALLAEFEALVIGLPSAQFLLAEGDLETVTGEADMDEALYSDLDVDTDVYADLAADVYADLGTDTEMLPETASSLPLVGWIGCGALAAAIALRLTRRRNLSRFRLSRDFRRFPNSMLDERMAAFEGRVGRGVEENPAQSQNSGSTPKSGLEGRRLFFGPGTGEVVEVVVVMSTIAAPRPRPPPADGILAAR